MMIQNEHFFFFSWGGFVREEKCSFLFQCGHNVERLKCNLKYLKVYLRSKLQYRTLQKSKYHSKVRLTNW